ncbi:hypothetical protein [Arthrobacter sp. TMS1-12-1]
MRKLVPALLVTIGVALMIMQILAESEPGALPAALIGLGLGAHVIMRSRQRKNRDQVR